MFESTARLDPEVQAAYLARLGLSAAPPSVDQLRLLVRRQAERVPYETLWIHAGERWDLDPHESAARIALRHRGGYCYHTNGALGLLLTSLGYQVHGHVGGVHGPDGPGTHERGNHLVLTVTGLPDDDNPAGEWWVDHGLGDALYDPVPLRAGPFDQPPFRLELERTDTGWHLTHAPGGGFTGMSWTDGEACLDDFAAQHAWLSTAAESGFVQVPMAERRDATGVDVVRGLVRSRIGDGARTDEPVTDREEWFDLLADLFDLRFEPEQRDRLWVSVLESHRRWEQRA